jgi:hypothetical protein
MPAISKGKASRAAKAGAQAQPKKEAMGGKAPANSSVNLWGIAGRQEIMEMRRLWQLRIPRPRNPKE